MKNRHIEAHRKWKANRKPFLERLFCKHHWEVNGKVPSNWDEYLLYKVPFRCSKCGAEKEVPAQYVEEIPDDRVDRRCRLG